MLLAPTACRDKPHSPKGLHASLKADQKQYWRHSKIALLEFRGPSFYEGCIEKPRKAVVRGGMPGGNCLGSCYAGLYVATALAAL